MICLLLTASLGPAFNASAQSHAGWTNGVSHAPGQTNFPPSVLERGPHHRVVQTFVQVRAPDGTPALRTRTATLFDSPVAVANAARHAQENRRFEATVVDRGPTWKTIQTVTPVAGPGHSVILKAKVKPSFDARDTIAALEHQMTSAIDQREDADIETTRLATLVVNSVKGDPGFGEDSDLYEAMGYVRKSERKTGLTRKKTPPPPAK